MTNFYDIIKENIKKTTQIGKNIPDHSYRLLNIVTSKCRKQMLYFVKLPINSTLIKYTFMQKIFINQINC